MARNGGRHQPAYSDLSGSESDQDGVGLVITDSDSKGRSRKYVVATTRGLKPRLGTPSMLRSLSRNEIICIVAGIIAFVAIVALFIVIGVVTGTQSAAKEANVTTEATPTTRPTTPPHTMATPPHTTVTPPQPWNSVRLPTNVIPEHYRIDLTLDLDNFAVSGSVEILCNVVDTTSIILVHAREMNIITSTVIFDYTTIEAEGAAQSNEFYVLTLPQEVGPGEVRVQLSFEYTLSEVLSGFYRSSYIDGDGQQRYLATTQFEATDARKAFPCFDEPSLKANFTISITHNSQYNAVSNMPPHNRTNSGVSMVTTSFETSVKMSTYLVAFIVSDFECMSETITEGRQQPLEVMCVCVGVVGG